MRLTYALIMGAAALALSMAAFANDTPRTIEVFKNPSCGCCDGWIEHLKKNGFKVQAHTVDDLTKARKRFGMPEKFATCHTARVAGYAIEGHVPAQDIKRLLAQKPKAIGIVVPEMPAGSPGMEFAKPAVAYQTLLVETSGATRQFAQHGPGRD